jgi:polyhydroxybutyrate depolymerase
LRQGRERTADFKLWTFAPILLKLERPVGHLSSMTRSLHLLVALALTVSCSEAPAPSGTGGSANGGSSASQAGASGAVSGGTSSVGGGGNSRAGNGSSGGGGDVGGSSGGGDVGGSSGSGGSGGGGGDKLPIVPSAGCGTQNPPAGPLTIETEGGTGNYIVSLPAAYDPSTPYPLGFGFHGANRTHEDCQNGDCVGFQEVMGDVAILVYMKSFDSGWGEADEPFFGDVLTSMKAGYCVDESRVFTAGTSSGAGFANRVGCHFGDQLLATAPVAGWMPDTDCVENVAALVIHGINDLGNDISGGREARDYYLEANGCGSTSVPAADEMDARVLAQREAMIEEGYECAVYDGCPAALPVHWCVHSYGGYDNINHGWPPPGGQIIWDFVSAL